MKDWFEKFLPFRFHNHTTSINRAFYYRFDHRLPWKKAGLKVWPNKTCDFTEDACITIGGPSTGELCEFPFVFKGTTYFTCANFMGGVACATAVDTDRKPLANQWGYCGPTCPQPQGKDLSINKISLMICRLYSTLSIITIQDGTTM